MLTKNQTQNILFLLLIIGVIIGLGFLIKWAVNKNKFEIPPIYTSSSIGAVATMSFNILYKVGKIPYTGMVITAAGMNSVGSGLIVTLIDNKSETYTNPINKLNQKWNGAVKSMSNIYGGLQGEIAMSGDGKYQLANSKNGSCMLSSDTGASWSSFAGLGRSIFFGQTAMSSNGKYQAVTFREGIFMSDDYGKTLKTTGMTGLPRGVYTCLKMSGTGQYLLAGMYNAQVLYVSSDYGTTWRRSTTFPPGMAPVSIEMTSNGQFQGIITGYPKQYVLSSDYGATWTVKNYPGGTSMIKFCQDGTYQYRVSDSNNISNSTDYGTTWLDTTGYPSNPVKLFLVSNLGTSTMVITQNNLIYTSYNAAYR